MTADLKGVGPAQTAKPRRKLDAGDRVPDFVLPTGPKLARSFHDCFTGPPAILLLADPAARPQVYATLESLKQAAAESLPNPLTLLVIERGPVQPTPTDSNDAVWFFDPEGQVSAFLRDQSGEAAIVLDREQRVIGRQESLADCTTWAVDLLRREVLDLSHQTTGFHAPVLTVRDVLEPALCRRLIADWAEDHREGGVRQAVTNRATTTGCRRNVSSATKGSLDDDAALGDTQDTRVSSARGGTKRRSKALPPSISRVARLPSLPRRP